MHLIRTLVGLLIWQCGLAQTLPAKKPLKVFVLAGQSNMEGQAVVDLEGKDYNQGKGNVRFVPTHEFVRQASDSPNPGHGHHEFGNAETYFLVGDALGRGMVSLLGGKTAAGHQTNSIEGWTVLVHERLLAEDKAVTAKALELLRAQLQEIVRVVPAPAVAKLREVTLWFSPEYPGVKPRAEYHPGAGWLRDNGRDPVMVKSVEFTDVRNFEAETRRMPNFTLHELAQV